MEAKHVNLKRFGINYGLLTGGLFILYFLIMRALDMVHVVELRFLSYFLIPLIFWLALRKVNSITEQHRINYLPGLGMGFWLTFVSSAVFAVFMYFYCELLEPGFVDYMRNYLPFREYLNSFMMASAAFGEPLILGVVLVFVVMQFFKRNAPDITEAEEEAEEHPRVKA